MQVTSNKLQDPALKGILDKYVVSIQITEPAARVYSVDYLKIIWKG